MSTAWRILRPCFEQARALPRFGTTGSRRHPARLLPKYIDNHLYVVVFYI